MLFPIEICENIIDSCRSPRPWWPQTALAKTGSYRTWMSCALTCRAWLARSRYNIYWTTIRKGFRHRFGVPNAKPEDLGDRA
ncbi:hypothetical protein K466DRAFT_155897 [Polyporus arcularius HHB13444]|uniref:F-box domain-containing protein n=1 Tax=Polyporus arcularius HHB13444 TaxID=1314778 RepID=A0A5C3PK73_9APHY|nr:hypothetical protein K466DRAFT_155897 [Polyporus arcularius HHB13444]